MDNSKSQDAIALVGRFHGTVLSLQEFDKIEVRPIIKDSVEETERNQCVVGIYYRTASNAGTLTLLKDPSHFQAISMIARSLIELAVDLRLLGIVPEAVERLIALSGSERLRAARNITAFAARNPDVMVNQLSLYQDFIANKADEIAARHERLWPGRPRVDHWSGMNMRERVDMLGAPFDRLYYEEYPRLSWAVHGGLTGVIGVEANTFPLMCGVALGIAGECYMDVLRSLIAELRLDKVISKVNEKLDLARMLPFTDSPQEASRLRDALLR